MTAGRCEEHLDALPCRGCAADAKALDDRQVAAREALRRQNVSPEHPADPRFRLGW